MDSIRTMKIDVSDVVARSVTNTFGVMFRREVGDGDFGEGFAEGSGQEICSRVSLWQDGTLNMDFCFHFDRELLSSIVTDAYPEEAPDKRTPLCEDIACAVANIVVSNVKTFLNGRGFDMNMNIPTAGVVAANGGQLVHLKFRCNAGAEKGDSILVNMQMQDRRKG
ncbi:MAG: hypothetical protein EPN97_15840 [Alphaproteobacteria bacterium]|nr:MAG: hypothetical protein EPN97_15840 [Alphaproteobacteria bacterium]